MILYMSETLLLPELLRQAVGPNEGRRRLHPVPRVLFAFVVGALAGISRMAHLEWLRDDVALQKYLRLSNWPVRKVFSSALTLVSDAAVARIEQLVGLVGLLTLGDEPAIVVDVDNTAIVSYGTAEGAQFGYCGKGRRRRRHYPIVASVAASRAVVAAEYRDGSEMTTEDHIKFFGDVLVRVRAHVRKACNVIFRADSGFWSAGLATWLEASGEKFVFAYPLYPAIKLALWNAKFEALTDDEDIEFASLDGVQRELEGKAFRVIVIRRRVLDYNAPPQGKVIKWSPEWRYQAIIANMDWSPPDLWRFYNYRAESERVFRIGKQALGMAHLVGHDFRANRLAFLLRLLAYNADLSFHLHCEREAHRKNRPARRVGLEWRQVRFYLSPGRFLYQAGRWVLRTPLNKKLEELWAFYGSSLLRETSRAREVTSS